MIKIIISGILYLIGCIFGQVGDKNVWIWDSLTYHWIWNSRNY